MADDSIIAPKEYRSVETYKAQLKEQLMEQIGSAQAVVLLKPTPKGEKRKRLMNPSKPKGPGNPEFTYVEQAYVSETLDIALMMDWDLVVTKSERIGDEAFVEGYIEARFKNNKTIKRYGYGGAVKRNNSNQSWGDVFKSATSDLLKNCAARMGVARDLYRHEEKEQEARPLSENGAVQQMQKVDDGRPALPAQLAAIATLTGIVDDQGKPAIDRLPEDVKKMSFTQASEKIMALTAKRGGK